MLKNTLKLCVLVMLTAGAVACGDDSKTSETTNNVTPTPDTGSDTGGEPDTGVEPDTGGGTANNNTDVITIPSCADPNPPARCAANPEGFEWGTASVISSFVIDGEVDAAGAAACCFDFNNDGAFDNALGTILKDLGQLESINTQLADSIASGSLLLVLEHAGLTSLTGGEFAINFFLGKYDGITAINADASNTVMVDSSSIDEGTQPYAMFPGASLAENKVQAGPGTLKLAIDILGTPLELTISQATVKADVDAAKSSLEGGVKLTSGTLGGVVKVADIYNGLNTYVATCDCLGNPEALIVFDPSDVAAATCATVDSSTCANTDEETCGTIAENCSLVSLLSSFADIDTTQAGPEPRPDAISVGARLEAAPAKITGVAAAE